MDAPITPAAARAAVADLALLACDAGELRRIARCPDSAQRFHDALTLAWLRSLPEDADLTGAYEALVGRSITMEAGRPVSSAGIGRRRAGAYYTPPALVDHLVRETVQPLCDDRPATEGTLEGLRILDPACGAGAFLLAALEALSERAAAASGRPIAAVRPGILRHCIAGVDADPIAVEVSRLRLARSAGVPPDEVTCVQCGDSLLDPPPVLGKPYPAFDCVLGNPPFLNAIERSGRAGRRRLLAALAPAIGGTADEAYHFMALAMRITRPGGRIGLVLPRAVLNAPAAAALRDAAATGWWPRWIDALDRSDHFSGPQVHVCLLTLGPTGPCRVVAGGRTAEGALTDRNWWRGMRSLLSGAAPEPSTGTAIGDVFTVRAGMTASEAYTILRNVRDEAGGGNLKLVTTGLIDPASSRWGQRRCRYLRCDFAFPRIDESGVGAASLVRRLREARRPKVIVAGLCSRVECFLDASGEYIGAVSTFAIFHPQDDIEALRRVEQALLTPEATERYRNELGANALGGGSIRMTRAFLNAFPCGEAVHPVP